MDDIVNNQGEVVVPPGIEPVKMQSEVEVPPGNKPVINSDKQVSYVFSTFNEDTMKAVRKSTGETQGVLEDPTKEELAALTVRELATRGILGGVDTLKENKKGKPSNNAKQLAKMISGACPWLKSIESGKGFKEAYFILDLIKMTKSNGKNSIDQLVSQWERITPENPEVLQQLELLDKGRVTDNTIYTTTKDAMKQSTLATLSLETVQNMAAKRRVDIVATRMQRRIFSLLEDDEGDDDFAIFLASGTGTGKTFALNIAKLDDRMLIRTHPSHIVCQQALQDSGPLTPSIIVSLTVETSGSITKSYLKFQGVWESLGKLNIKFEIDVTNGKLVGWAREENWPRGYEQWFKDENEGNGKHNMFQYYYLSLIELQSQKNTRRVKTVIATRPRAIHCLPQVRSKGMSEVLNHAEKFCDDHPQYYHSGVTYVADDTGTESKVEGSHFECLINAKKLLIMCGNGFDHEYISKARVKHGREPIVKETFSDALGEGSRLFDKDTNQLHSYTPDQISANPVASGTLRRDDIEMALFGLDNGLSLRNQIIDGSDLNKLRRDALEQHAEGNIDLTITAARNLTLSSPVDGVKLYAFTEKDSLWDSVSKKFIPENLSKVMRSFEKQWSSYCSSLESYDKQTESMRKSAAKSSKTDSGSGGKEAGEHVLRERSADRPVFDFGNFSYMKKLNIAKVFELSHLVDDRELYMLLRYGIVVLSTDSDPRWYSQYLSTCKTIYGDANTIGTGINIPFLTEIHMMNEPGELPAEKLIQIYGRSGRPGHVPGLVFGNASDFELAVDPTRIGLGFDNIFRSWLESENEERLEVERAEAERIEAERLEAERLEAERLEAERLEAERLEAERLEAERLEVERLEAERLEAERLEAERLEAERLQGHVHTRTQEGKAKRTKNKNAKQKQKREEMQELVSTFQPTLMQDGNYWVTSPEGMWYQLFYDENQKPWFNRTSTNEIIKFPMKLSIG